MKMRAQRSWAGTTWLRGSSHSATRPVAGSRRGLRRAWARLRECDSSAAAQPSRGRAVHPSWAGLWWASYLGGEKPLPFHFKVAREGRADLASSGGVLSHPFAENAKGWGTERLCGVKAAKSNRRSFDSCAFGGLAQDDRSVLMRASVGARRNRVRAWTPARQPVRRPALQVHGTIAVLISLSVERFISFSKTRLSS